MSIYRVEKSELPVVIFQADGSIMKGVVFLSATAYSHMGQQTLLDLMKEELQQKIDSGFQDFGIEKIIFR